MEIKRNIKLSDYNTFKTGGNAEYFCEVKNEDELIKALKFAKNNNLKFIVIGNGSNLLIKDEDYLGLVIKMSIKGKDIDSKNDVYTIVSACAGESFDDFISFVVSKGLSGIENLWNIPGTIGASAVQNIGAYGTEVKDYIVSVECIDADSLNKFIYKNENCNFGYRESIFKNNKNLIITKVFFKLNNFFSPNISYPSLKECFLDRKDFDIKEIISAIENIRKNKLPDWKVFGTAGSFFKNPIISEREYNILLLKYPALPKYLAETGFVKIPLGFVIDKICGLKGFKIGKVGLYEKQSLIIVNYGGVSYFEINNFAKIIEEKVYEKIKIKIEREVEVI